MKNEIFEQLLGSTQFCVEYNEKNYREHYELLKEADEFSAAASLYPEERNDLLAHSLHRYQQLIDKAVSLLKLDIEFLVKKKVFFNFYTDIANLFGLGTQAYTTESTEPYIGISELSLQDVYLLQLVLLHEIQHAADFVFFDGLGMGIAERELRARLTICHSLNEIQKQFNKLYKNAYVDQSYWYVILFSSPNVDKKIKQEYYELLEKNARKILEEEDGVVFSPLILRVFGRELEREKVLLKPNTSYRLFTKNGDIRMEEGEAKVQVPEEVMSEMEDTISNDIETINDGEPLALKLAKLTGQRVAQDGENITLVKNKLAEWHTFKDEFKNLRKSASIVITRNAETIANIASPQDTSLSVPKIIKIDEKKFENNQPNELSQLKNLEIPGSATYNTNFNDEEVVILPNRPNYTKKTVEEVEEEEPEEDYLARDVMSNLSQFVNKKRE